LEPSERDPVLSARVLGSPGDGHWAALASHLLVPFFVEESILSSLCLTHEEIQVFFVCGFFLVQSFILHKKCILK